MTFVWPTLISAISAALALVGLYISLYFTLLTYGIVTPGAPLVPAVCRLADSSCRNVVHTPAARLLAGIPNAVVGLGFYGLVLVSIVGGWNNPAWLAGLLAAAGLAVASGVYLVVQLYRVMRVSCSLCITAHVINVLLAVTIGLRLLATI